MNDRAARVRVVGPLARYANGFAAVLVQRGYAPSSAAGQLQLMAHLSRWLVQSGLAGSDVTASIVEQFLQARRAAGYGQWLSVRGMAPLLAYLRGVGLAPNGSYRADNMTGSVPGSRRWMSTVAPLDLSSPRDRSCLYRWSGRRTADGMSCPPYWCEHLTIRSRVFLQAADRVVERSGGRHSVVRRR